MFTGNPIVIAYHLIWTLYGWWLPNDPRGSGSHIVATDVLAELGQLHLGRKTIQPPAQTVRDFYAQAVGRLKYPLLNFDPAQFSMVADALGAAIAQCRYTCYACAVMNDHVHVLIRRHRDPAEQMIENLQMLSRKRLVTAGLRAPEHPAWTQGGWKVFLDHPEEIRRTIQYIDRNPLERRWPAQHWPFVTAYDNWPLHPGHSPNSPYTKALRAAGRYP